MSNKSFDSHGGRFLDLKSILGKDRYAKEGYSVEPSSRDIFRTKSTRRAMANSDILQSSTRDLDYYPQARERINPGLKQVIYCPPDTSQLPHREDVPTSFISFKTIFYNNPTVVPPSLAKKEPEENVEARKFQLKFNRIQQNGLEKSAREGFTKSFRELYNSIEFEQSKIKKMPRVKVFESRRWQDDKFQDQDFEKSSTIDENFTNKKPDFERLNAKLKKNREKASWPVFWQEPNFSDNWKPEVREGAILFGYGSNGYLFGGVSYILRNQLTVLDYNTMKWSQVKQTGDIPDGRIGHSISLLGKFAVLYGGQKLYNSQLQMRDCLGDIKLLDLGKYEWKNIITAGQVIEPRRNHIGVIVGRHLLVHGGIDSYGVFLDDLKLLNLTDRRWSDCYINNPIENPVAFHTGVVIIHESRGQSYDIYKSMDPLDPKKPNFIQLEGLYIFGGINADGIPNNSLKVIKFGKIPKWVIPITKGIPPAPRFQHSMNYLAKVNLIVIYGGRNDDKGSKPEDAMLSDISALRMDNLCWLKVDSKGFIRGPRCCHAAGNSESKLFIFGGISNDRYRENDVTVIEFDQDIILDLERSLNKNSRLPFAESIIEPILPIIPSAEKVEEPVPEPVVVKDKYEGLLTFVPIPIKGNLKKRSEIVSQSLSPTKQESIAGRSMIKRYKRFLKI